MGVNKIINSPVVNKLKICDLKSSRSLKYTAIIIIAITTRVNFNHMQGYMGEISPNLLLKPESIRNFIQLPGFLLLQKSLLPSSGSE